MASSRNRMAHITPKPVIMKVELSAATGMNRPSLYAAFGDKRRLYLTVIDRFAQMMEAAVSTAMADAPTLADALARFYGGALDVYLSGDEGARGCFVICTAAVDAPHEPLIREALQAVLALIDQRLAAPACVTEIMMPSRYS